MAGVQAGWIQLRSGGGEAQLQAQAPANRLHAAAPLQGWLLASLLQGASPCIEAFSSGPMELHVLCVLAAKRGHESHEAFEFLQFGTGSILSKIGSHSVPSDGAIPLAVERGALCWAGVY